ncbi:uncharacterized protein C8Q71DRAFT_750327 [Rhodofomes roseus]|uniref:NACHT domain-containing protein n=1 Tax=Rhodofomes roseus TaxID=34475 RepID=A0ABQ8KJH5_9APHY|nr:uncharacterized protein C8Q71DRAFT_750327 [Rhodofomes roseus]KAH9838292.1 hypothetical protein C8Q71DRAFT_750327 [Rhodofomes roseus]
MAVPTENAATITKQHPFQRAFEAYLKGLDEKAKAKDFFARYCSEDKLQDPQSVNRDMKEKVDERRSKSSATGKILQTLAGTQKTFDGVVNALTSLDPTNVSGAVWACVSVLAKTVDSYVKVPEKISKALTLLGDDLKRIATYGRILGESLDLEDAFFQSFFDMFRFWSRVFRELGRHRITSILSALVLPADRFDDIIAAMRTNAEILEKQFERVKEEREFMERSEKAIRSFLGQPISTGGPTFVTNSRQLSAIEDQCCAWIFEDPTYQAWRKGEMDSTVPTALWVYAPPGSGKTTLCERVVRAVREEQPSVAVASHFFRFDQTFTTLDILKSIAVQLWEFWASQHYPDSHSLLPTLSRLADDKTKDAASRVRSILDTLVQALPTVYFFIDGVDEEAAKAVNDTLHRDTLAAPDARSILDVIERFISSDKNRRVHLWISSQDVSYTRKKLENYTQFDIKHAVQAGIRCYLTRSILDPAVVPLAAAERESILQRLMKRVESNFLWAHLMVVELKKATNSAEINQILEDGRADELDEYYARFLDSLKLLPSNKASISRDVLSLVTFARRPLTVGEIQEAIAILNSKVGYLDDSRKPFLSTLLSILSPLIEVGHERHPGGVRAGSASPSPSLVPGPGDQGYDDLKKTCRLFHSTLFDFLHRQAELLYDGSDMDEDNRRRHAITTPSPNFRISPLRIADACLLYLTQTRYLQLLRRRDDTWVDAGDQPVSAHHFLTYSAKNWDKHLDLVSPNSNNYDYDPSPGAIAGEVPQIMEQFRSRVEDFIHSAKFRTCMQVQSLWIDASFSHYSVRSDKDHQLWLRRILPRFIVASDSKYHTYYHRFWWDWYPFLSCATCDNPRCHFRSCAGEIDRCWWRCLGSGGDFLTTLDSRYFCFRFEATAQTRESLSGAYVCDFQTAFATQDSVRILQLTSAADASQLRFHLETWSYSTDKSPILQKSQDLLISDTMCDAALYATSDSESMSSGARSFSICEPGGGAPLASFSNNGQYLRIGTQIFTAECTGEYRAFIGTGMNNIGYIEEFEGHDGIAVVASRRRRVAPTMSNARRHSLYPDASLGQLTGIPCAAVEDSDSESPDSDTEDDASISSESSGNYEDGGYETWSECSSALTGSEDDLYAEYPMDHDRAHLTLNEDGDDQVPSSGYDLQDHGWPARTHTIGSSIGDVDTGSASSDEAWLDEGESEYADSNEGIEPSEFAYGQLRRYAEEDRYRCRQRRRNAANGSGATQCPRAEMRIFTSEGRLFRFSRRTPAPLSDSPPAFHPSQPLVVWPLGGLRAQVLFVDYEDITYFIREIRTGVSEPDSVILTMRCHFTDNGQYLHIAVAEGRPVVHGMAGDSNNASDDIQVRLYCYRLCTQKPTRSPPHLVHTSSVNVGIFDRDALSPRCPWTLTWTHTYLYVTWSHTALLVYRIPLFHQRDTPDDVVIQRPGETVLLPASARYRDVFFFPSEGDHLAQVIVGGPIVREKRYVPPKAGLATPVGCILRTADQLGGWVATNHAPMPKRYMEAGQLNVPSVEQFDPDVDCVLEPFLWQE